MPLIQGQPPHCPAVSRPGVGLQDGTRIASLYGGSQPADNLRPREGVTRLGPNPGGDGVDEFDGLGTKGAERLRAKGPEVEAACQVGVFV